MSEEPAPDAESPWALVLRLRAAGASIEQVVMALRERGVAHGELELLLSEEIAAQRRPRLNPPGELSVPTGRAPVLSRTSSPLGWAGVVTGALLLFTSTCLVVTHSPLVPLVVGALGIGSLAAGLTRLRQAPRRFVWGRTALTFAAISLPTTLLSLFVPFTWWTGAWATVFVGSVVTALVVRGRGRLPSVADFEARGPTYEHQDVQLRVNAPSPAKVAFGGVLELIVHAQNVVRAPRELQVVISGDTGVVSNELRHAFPLRPGYVHQLVIPVRVCAVAVGPHQLDVTFSGAGVEQGDRVQVSTGATFWARTDTVATRLINGAFEASPQVSVRVSIDPALPPVEASPRAQAKVVFEPSDEDLERAAKG
ncbi:MAG: hypothetical protein U0228_31310 [Myxococcaceae bacterium]